MFYWSHDTEWQVYDFSLTHFDTVSQQSFCRSGSATEHNSSSPTQLTQLITAHAKSRSVPTYPDVHYHLQYSTINTQEVESPGRW